VWSSHSHSQSATHPPTHSAQPLGISPLDSAEGADLLRDRSLDVEEIIEVLEELALDFLRQDLRDPLAQQVHLAEQQAVVFFGDDAVAVEFRVSQCAIDVPGGVRGEVSI